MNLLVLLEMACASFGERVAVCCETASGRREALTYAELLESVGRAAGRLRASGAQHAALLDVTSPALPIALFASASASLPFVPLSYRLTDPELEVLLARIAPAFLVTDAERSARLAARADVTPIAREDFLAAARSVSASSPPGQSASLEHPPQAPEGRAQRGAAERSTSGFAAAQQPTDPEAIAVLLFTSGT